MSEPRAQHYIPQFLLQNFTLTGREDEHLWVTAPVQRKRWQSRPKETGHQRDFYRVEAEGTGVLFPVSRHLMLIGSESELGEVIRLNKKEVAQTNRITLVNTDQYVYSAKEEFPWLDRSGKVRYEMPPMTKDETPAVMDAYIKGSPVPEPVIELRERPLKLLA